MSHPNPSTAMARVIVDELAAGGVSVAVVSPGSRSGALAIAFAEHPEIEVRVFIDERSAAFHALGVARVTGAPAAVVSTSGTAAANHFPAVVEADYGCVPLIAISADRPPELHGVGANQTIDQMELFGQKVREFVPFEAPDGSDGNEGWRKLVQRALSRALGPKPGPVHLNIAFREPTVPVSDDGRSRAAEYLHPTPRLDSGLTALRTEPGAMPEIHGSSRGLVIAGDGEYDREALATAAAAVGWPVLATALSSMRGDDVITAYQALMAGGLDDRLSPDAVVAIGNIGPDPALERLVSGAAHRIRVDRWGRHIDPERNATSVLIGDPVHVLKSVAAAAPEGWQRSWREADAEAVKSMTSSLAARDAPTGGGVAALLNDLSWGALVVGSSLPIREVDTHLRRSGPVFANRGASGIDGFVSTALGVASALPKTLAICGDLSLLHDSNGFLNDAAIDATFIVMDNGGGGLFDSLPQSRHAPQFERLFITPPRTSPQAIAEAHGIEVSICTDLADLAALVDVDLGRPGIGMIVVPIDREYDREMRSQLVG